MKRNREDTGSLENHASKQPRKIKVKKCERDEDIGYPILKYSNLKLRKPV